MENKANGLRDSFVARHTTDHTLRLELLCRNQNGLHHDRGSGMGAEVLCDIFTDWNIPIFIYLNKLTLFETAQWFMTHQNEHSKRIKWVYIARSKSYPCNTYFCKLSYFVSFLQIAGSHNIATDSSAAGCPSAEVFPKNFQALTLFALSALNIRPWNVESLGSANNSPLALVQGVARATVQMKRRMREREQRESEREQFQTKPEQKGNRD